MVKLLIADDNEEFRLALTEQMQPDFSVYSCGTGRQALTLLRQEQPELLVLDLMLPELDGVTLLELASQEGLHPKVLAVCPLLNDYVLDCAQRLGIRYLMRPPCAMEALRARLQDLSQEHSPPSQDPERLAKELLQSLGINIRLDGAQYMLICLRRLLEDPSLTMTKHLYPEIAKATGHSLKGVEHSIRHAIESGWKRGSRTLWLHYFPNANDRPSNAVFLSRLLEELKAPAE